MIDRLRAFYDRLVLDRPWAVLVFLGVVVAVMVTQAGNFRLDASSDSLLLEGDEDLRYYRKVLEQYGTRDFLFVTYNPHAPMLDAAMLEDLEALREALLAVPAVEDVVTILDVPLLNSPPIDFTELGSTNRTLRDADVDRELAQRELTTSPFYSDMLMSKDGETTALAVYLKTDTAGNDLLRERTRLRDARDEGTLDEAGRQRLEIVTRQYADHMAVVAEQRARNVAEVRAVLDRHREGARIFLGGVAMIASDMIDFIGSDLRTFGLSVFVFLILMLTVIFRRLRWILLPLAACAASVVMMMGTLALARWPVTVISSNFVSLLLIICMSMTIHLVVRFRELQAKEPDVSSRDLVARTVHFMFIPILYAALTTMVAFVSLLISGIRPVIDFGYMMTAGIAMAFGVIFLLFPAVVVLLPRTHGEERDFTRGVTLAFARLTERHRKPILGVAAVLAVVSAFGAARLDVENRFIDYFDADTEIFQGMLEIDRHLGGTTPLDILLEADPEALVGDEEEFEEDFYGDLEEEGEESSPGYWFNPLRLGELRQLHEWLDAQPEIGKVLSLDTMIRMAESINDGEPLDDLKISLFREGLSRLPEDMQDVLLRPFMSEDGNRLRVQLRVIDSDTTLRRAELIERVDAFLAEKMAYDESRYRQSGLLVLYNNVLQSLFASQIQTIGFVFLSILAMFLVLFRSLRLALIAILPNMLPALLVLGTMGWLGIPLDLMTITIAAISVGIAVDNTIHYIIRFRREFPEDRDYRATMWRCHGSIGRAMYYTSLTIVVGFSILMLSNFVPTFYFGLFTGLAMLTALVASLALLPALLLTLRPMGEAKAD
ncbi:MAG: MMPL family transporter [Gammaproteobacteria bacterium]|nr:MMPL family transporter [Gammaproteobacteria bacterium]